MMLSQRSHSSACFLHQHSARSSPCSSSRILSGSQGSTASPFSSYGRKSSFKCRKQTLQATSAATSQRDETQVVPMGYMWYETMILLRPNLDEEARDMELAKFEAYLQKENAVGIDVLVRGNNQALAYPIKGHWDGIYVLYTYAALPVTAKGVQRMLTAPGAGTVSNILRHMTHKLS